MSSDWILPVVAHLNQSAAAAYLLLEVDSGVKVKNNPPVIQQRLCWDKFVTKKRGLRNFHRHLRMSMDSFNKLLLLILPGLIDEDNGATGQGGPILPELGLYSAL
jgi:hypothetical protein